jgi:hypothetical protein
MNKKCLKHNKPQPCGPCRIESSKRPPQQPPIPLRQLEPSHSQVVIAAENLEVDDLTRMRVDYNEVGIRKIVADRTLDSGGYSWKAGKPVIFRPPIRQEKKVSTRERYGLSRREVADLLQNSKVAATLAGRAVLAPHEIRQFEALAAGNISEADLAKQIGGGAAGLKVFVDDWERKIIQTALLEGVLKPLSQPRGGDDFDREIDAGDAAQQAAIERSGGASIGGSVITRGIGSKGQTLALDSFERGGQIRRSTGSVADNDFSSAPGRDDYGPESGDDIPRSD